MRSFLAWMAAAAAGLVLTGCGGGGSGGAHNIIFVSSQAYAANLGSLGAYDQKCNDLATAAGLESAGDDVFVAWMSSTTQDARDRIGNARGFVRVDGTPVANDLASDEIFNPVELDETGSPVTATFVTTGTDGDGTVLAGNDCSDWTDNSSAGLRGGTPFGGPYQWSSGAGTTCDNSQAHIYCVETDHTAPVQPVQTAGRLIFLSNTEFSPGTGTTPDQLCDQSKPASVSTAVALISTSTAAASSLLDPSAVYVRPDGQRVGTGSELVATDGTGAALPPESGIWQFGNGQYANVANANVWTGSTTPGQTGTNDCSGWSAGTGQGHTGFYQQLRGKAWWSWTDHACASTAYVYCVQQ